MNLGALRCRLADFDQNEGVIEGVTAHHTPYSGDHLGIALVPGARVKVITLRKYLTAIVGRQMNGARGVFVHDGLPVYLAAAGETGPRIVGVSDSCRLVVMEKLS